MKKRNIWLVAVVLAVSASALANPKGDAFSWVKVKLIQTEGCAVTVVDAGVQDSDAQNSVAKAFFGGPHHGRTSDVRYDIELKATSENVAAVEVEWLGLNALDETVGSRKSSYSWKKPMPTTKSKSESDLSDRITGDVSTYAVRVFKVKFVDGTLWTRPADPAP